MVTKNSVIRDIEFFLPEDWTIKVLGEISDVRDGTHDSPKYLENGYPLITSKNLKTNGLDFKNVNFISEEDHYKISERSKVDTGDILFGMIGTLGNPVIVKEDDGQFSIKNVALIKFNNSILNNVFLKNLLNSTFIEKIFNRISDGGVQKFIALGTIRKLPIPLPPLKEQQKIASILSSVDETIKKTKGILEQATLVKRGIMHELFSEGIGNTEYKDSEVGRIPKSWKVVDMGTIFDTIDGDRGKNYPNTNDFIDEGYCLFLDTKNVTKSGFMFDTKKFISKEKDKMLRNGKLSRNDFVMTSRGSIGNIAFYSENVPYENIRINSAMLILRPYDKDLNFDFWMHLLRGRVIEKYIRKFKVGSAQPHITKKSFQQLKVSIPSSSKEQQKISNILNEFDNKIRNEEENLLYLDSLKRGLMQQLLTGKVRVPTTESEEVPQ